MPSFILGRFFPLLSSKPTSEMSQSELREAKRAAQYGMPVGSVVTEGGLLQPGKMGAHGRGLKPFLKRGLRPTCSGRKSVSA